MNVAGSLVESYMYADMYNREYEGGSDVQEKIYIGGFPVTLGQDGGKSPKTKHDGPLSNKVVPAGLVLIQIRREPDVEYEDHFCPGENREVIPDKLYDMLMGSILVEKRRNRTPPRKQRERSRRNRRK